MTPLPGKDPERVMRGREGPALVGGGDPDLEIEDTPIRSWRNH
jgi:hypothetical protein